MGSKIEEPYSAFFVQLKVCSSDLKLCSHATILGELALASERERGREGGREREREKNLEKICVFSAQVFQKNTGL